MFLNYLIIFKLIFLNWVMILERIQLEYTEAKYTS